MKILPKLFYIKNLLGVMIISLLSFNLHAQAPLTVSGKVVSDNGEVLPSVSVTLKGSTIATATTANGTFSINVPNRRGTLVFTSLGYGTREEPISNRLSVDVSLSVDAKSLDQVVVVGYGTVKKRDLTGAVSSVKPQEIASMPVANLGQGLAGRVPGVQVTQTGGGPGSNPVIRIRGGNSVNGSNDPLWVIDGFISGSGAETINPEDVESIEVLKDASATSIYGSRGANGVILVTTKRGKAGKPTVNFKSYYGIQTLSKNPELMTSEQTLQYYRAFDPNYFDQNLKETTNTDWIKEFTRDAAQQSHFISVNGGNQAINYKVSLDYFQQDGLIKYNSDYQRINMRANMDIKISSHVKSGVNVYFGRSARNDVGGGGTYQTALGLLPLVAPYNADGSYNYFLNPRILTQPGQNPIQVLRETQSPSTNRDLNLQGYIAVDIAKFFTFRSDFSTGFNNSWSHGFSPSSINAQTPASSSSSEGYQYEWVNTLNFRKKFNSNHDLSAVIGATAQYNTDQSVSASNRYFPSDIYAWYNLNAGAPLLVTDKGVGSGFGESSILSYLARINYTLYDKYLFTLTGRADGSSKFGKDNKWGYFPSGAFAWRASNESFIKNLNLFDDLKLRASYGIIGSQSIGSYQTLALLSRVTGFFGSTPQSPYGTTVNAFYPDRLAAPNLKWETTTQTDIGLDAGMLGNRLRFSADYYYKKTTDLLMSKLLPPETGYGETLANFGSIENRGFEFTISGDPITKKNFTWSSTLNLSLNRNKVVDLGPNVDRIAQPNKDYEETVYLQKGQPLGVIYTYLFDGIWQDAAQIAATPHRPSDKPGDVRIKDADGNGTINSNDKVLTGNPNPKFIAGFSNDILFKNLELSIFFQGMSGHDIFNYGRYNLYNRLIERLDYWTPQNGSNIQPSAKNENVPVTNDFIEKGSFLRLRSLTLRYNLASDLLKRVNIPGANLFVTGYNLATLTNYRGFNPEANRSGGTNTVQGIDYSTYPLEKTVIIGVNIRF